MTCTKLIILGTVSALALTYGPAALAQQAPASAAGAPQTQESEATNLDEIVVTATKQASNVQDVPLTVNVVRGEDVEKQVILKFEDVATLTPGLSLTNRDGRQQQASVRGVAADLDAGSSATVDIYLNETVLDAATAFQSIYDVGQIEVVRGPQGTLRGRASPSGAILITTRRPGFSGIDGQISATVTDNGVQNYQGAVGGPLSDTLAVRLAGLYDEGDDTGVKGLNNGREAGHETWSARASVAWRPTDAVNIDLMYQTMESDSDSYFAVYGSGAEGDYDIYDRVNFQEGPTTFSNESDIVTLTGSYDFANETRLSYVGGYQNTQFDTLRDLDIGNAIPFFQYDQDIRIGSETWSHELRFERTGNHFWKYMFGAYYASSDSDVLVDIPLAALVQTSKGESNNLGLFTNHAFQLTDRDVVQFGVRYSKTESDSVTNSNLAGISSESSEYDAYTGSASYQHSFTDDLMAYATYGRGYRPGGRAEDPTAPYLPESLKVYDEETSDSFELGLKSQMFDRRLTLNLTAYNQTFTNFIGRLNGIACTGAPGTAAPGGLGYATADGSPAGIDCNANFTFNGDGVSRGVELEARGRITDDWTATFNAAYTNAHFDDALIPCNDFNGDGTPDIEGDRRVQANQYVSMCTSDGSLGALPEWSFAVASEYVKPIGRFEGFVRGLVNYSGEVTTLNTGFTADSYTLANLFLGVRDPVAGWELTVFAKNLFDHQQQLTEEGSASLFGVPSPYRFGTVSQPREVGVTLRYAFGS